MAARSMAGNERADSEAMLLEARREFKLVRGCLEMRRGRLPHEHPRGLRGDATRAALLVLPAAGPLSHRSTAHRSGSIQPL